MRYNFNMVIGDYFGDGHGRTQSFHIGTDKPIKDVLEAQTQIIAKLVLTCTALPISSRTTCFRLMSFSSSRSWAIHSELSSTRMRRGSTSRRLIPRQTAQRSWLPSGCSCSIAWTRS